MKHKMETMKRSPVIHLFCLLMYYVNVLYDTAKEYRTTQEIALKFNIVKTYISQSAKSIDISVCNRRNNW